MPAVRSARDAFPKVHFEGRLLSIQPRIRLLRSFDEAAHVYLGYVLRVRGRTGREAREFTVGIGQAALGKHELQAGSVVQGECVPVADPRLEVVEFYKVSGLESERASMTDTLGPPPWHGVPPSIPVYRERGCRRLNARTYDSRCGSCIWGCRMAVEMIIDQWKPDVRKYRQETFCYGPKSCSVYRAGPTRRVPGRKGMVYEEEDWVDEEAVSHRGPNE